MLMISTHHDLNKVNVEIPASLMHFVKAELHDLCQSLIGCLNDQEVNLLDHGYSVYVLEPTDDQAKSFLLGCVPEYVECHPIQGADIYKVCFMEDNECFTLMYSVKGSQTEEVECWLQDNADVRGGAST